MIYEHELLLFLFFSLSLKKFITHLRYSLSLVPVSVSIPTNILPGDIPRPGGKLRDAKS